MGVGVLVRLREQTIDRDEQDVLDRPRGNGAGGASVGGRRLVAGRGARREREDGGEDGGWEARREAG